MKPKTIEKLIIALFAVILLFAVSAFAVSATGTEPTQINSVYQIKTADELIWFANQVNTVEGKNNIDGKLIYEIDLNPGYTFTFDPDTGLVKVEKVDGATVYLGTGIKGESGGNATFDETPSIAGAFYSSISSSATTDKPDGLNEWTPIGIPFDNAYTGIFGGNGKTVSGIYINGAQNYVGLFGFISGTGEDVGTVNSLKVANSYIKGKFEVGGVCGHFNSSSELFNCSSSATVIGNDGVGGVFGGGVVNVEYCYNTGAVKGNYYVGGVCGSIGNISMISCYNTGAVYGNHYVGGVCGRNINGGTIANCYNTGAVTGDYYVSGVCSENKSTGATNAYIANCYNTGAIKGNYYVGGVCGYNYISGTAYAYVTNCYNTGSVTGTNTGSYYIGGICGYNENNSDTVKAYVKDCYNTGSVTVTGTGAESYYVGGVCGWNNNGSVTNCFYLTNCAQNGSIAQNGIGNTIGNIALDDPEKTADKSATEFASGAVAWLLNGGAAQVTPLVWYQTLTLTGDGADTSPTLNDTHGTVYKGGYDSQGFKSETEGYSNELIATLGEYQPAKFNNNGTSDISTDDYYEIANAGNLFWFAAEVNGGNNTINGKLMTDIYLNPGYTFTFVPDTGLVEVKKDTETVYLGTGIKGTSGGNNTTFDETASTAGAFYSLNGTNYAPNQNSNPGDLRVWTPIGNSANSYIGTFDGNNKTVSGIYINDEGANQVGLFGSFGNSGTASINKIENITISDSFIRGSNYVGSIYGYNFGKGKVNNCRN